MTDNLHYEQSKIQTFDIVDDWNLDFYLGNVIKYIQRSKLKGQEESDILKAIDYLNEYYERNFTKEKPPI